jgi:hypothetical protein
VAQTACGGMNMYLFTWYNDEDQRDEFQIVCNCYDFKNAIVNFYDSVGGNTPIEKTYLQKCCNLF